MKRRQNGLQGILAAMGFLVLILDSALAVKGAKDGMELCIKTVIPSLFPFFVLSSVLTGSLAQQCPRPVRMAAKSLGIPNSAASILIPAFLGGYPVGAKSAKDLWKQGQITKNEAQWLLSFCSNAGPSFLFGMAAGFFPDTKAAWLLWGIHILSGVLTAAVISRPPVRDGDHVPVGAAQAHSVIFTAARAMMMVCCWVVLFRIVITFLDLWFFRRLPDWLRVLLTGLLELTNGCCELAAIGNEELRFVLCACMLSFGGICVFFQTAAVTEGLSLKGYAMGKLMQTLFSLLLSLAVVSDFRIIYLTATAILPVILRKIQNHYSNLRTLPV